MEPNSDEPPVDGASQHPLGNWELDPEWQTETVVGLARGILQDSAYERMPILADALEEAGCTDQQRLSQCRAAKPSFDDCDVLLSKLLEGQRVLPARPQPKVEPRQRDWKASSQDSGGEVFGTIGLLFAALLGFILLNSLLNPVSPTKSNPVGPSYQKPPKW